MIMKELTITLSADVVFTLGRAAERAGFATLADYVAFIALRECEKVC